MLLNFSANNFFSFKERQSISMVASSLKDSDEGLLRSAATPDDSVLPAIVIYGANASGKSNLVNVLSFIRWVALYSHSKGSADSKIGTHPYRLDSTTATQPSTFDIDFVVDGTRYHYGFECSADEFDAEWLHSFPNNRRQMLFNRQKQEFKFGRALKGQNNVISHLTRPNSSFLSAAVQNDHEELSKLAGFFRSITFSGDGNSELSPYMREDVLDSRVIPLLTKLGTGVVDYRTKKTPVTEEMLSFRRDLASAIQRVVKEFPENYAPDESNEIQLGHKTNTDEIVYFDWRMESLGTRRLLALLRPILKVLDAGSVLVIDELAGSLHTQACEAILMLFSLPTTNPKGAQLIATTHDTNLLRFSVLRRDQVWFTEKDAEGASHVYPLSDFRTRKEDNIELGYMQGRYGAIPFSGSVRELLEKI